MRKIFVCMLNLVFLIGAVAVPAEKYEKSRMPLVSEHPDDPALAKVFDGIRARGGDVNNVFRVTANSPELYIATGDFSRVLRFKSETSRELLELSILRTTQNEQGDYEFAHHVPIAKSCGVTQPQIDALAQWRKSSVFNPKERVVLAYADGMSQMAGPDDATYKMVSSLFNNKQIIELTLTNGFYVMQARLVKAIHVPLEEHLPHTVNAC